MPKLMIFDRGEKYVGNVKNIISAKHIIELNGEDFLQLETTDIGIEKGFRILFHDRPVDKFYEFIVQEKDEVKQGDVIVSNIYADNSLSETIGDYIADKRSIKQKPSHAIQRALEPTRWQVGKVDKVDELGTVTFYRTNARAAINAIMEEWLFEIETVVTFDKSNNKINRKINFLTERGEPRGTRLTYTRDLVDIKRKVLPGDVITAMRGFGKGQETASGGFGRRIDFSSINDGKDYVEDTYIRDTWGRIGKDGERMHTFGVVEFDNITDKQRLLDRTWLELGRRKFPQVSYIAKVNDFYRLTNSKHDYIELGDTVRVIDREFTPEIDYVTRILRIERDLLNSQDTEITLGMLVRNLADREAEQDKGINDKLEDWGNDEDTEWDPGELPNYERAEDLIKANPSLGIGLSSWIDINEKDKVLTNDSGRVAEIKDVITDEPVFRQSLAKVAPKLLNSGGRRWLTFNPDPRTLNRWPVGESRPDYSINQDGEYMDYLKIDDDIRSIVIAFHDRTPMPTGGFRDGYTAEQMYQTGTSCPIGYPFAHLHKYLTRRGVSIVGALRNKTFVVDDITNGFNSRPFDSDRTILPMTRERDMNTVSIYIRNVKVLESLNIQNIGMNKEKYGDYVSSAINYSIDAAKFIYEMNAFYTGEIAEIILYKRELGDNEMKILREYLTDKYEGTFEQD